MGVFTGIICSTTILLFTLIITIIIASTNTGFQKGFGEPFHYDAHTLSQISVSIHLLINILSIILLAASNCTMQVMASPTRADIDKAHRTGQWFDISVLSLRNLKRIPRRRKILCALPGLSSVPVHLL
ncbi:hypothetical protein EJ04DRAFT_171897 [Polyplosphaeria fusca]|uniref:DUF6536 domain-containing protein n=1 Tax=Polyplosphaeria fusca TaxID=682080 RepID=A0A9P4QHW0_9PLEO|nr:hypothetical protein EJ04DRAFT_171897 [Polyplosphaeria fusca]